MSAVEGAGAVKEEGIKEEAKESPEAGVKLEAVIKEEEDIGDKVGCCTLVGGKHEIDVITETSLGQSVVSVRQDCSMEGVRLPARSTIAR